LKVTDEKSRIRIRIRIRTKMAGSTPLNTRNGNKANMNNIFAIPQQSGLMVMASYKKTEIRCGYRFALILAYGI
jgi:hypothetical protein